ncbi:MAG TPA: glycosyl hydrolase family 28-related protein [Prosthecobacter sp.]|nr:glycosyl hydrolase family 28-related protein [Prosthecobacter sp.]
MTRPDHFFRRPALGAGLLLLLIGALGFTVFWILKRTGPDHFVAPSGGSAAINRAIAKCAETGGEVRLGAGTYVCKEPIILRHSNVTLRGAGDATRLVLADKANCPVLIIGDEAKDPRHKVTGVRVSDLTIDGNRENQDVECWEGACDTGEKTVIRSNGITLRRAVGVTVERVTILRCRSGGLVTEKGCRRLTVRGLTASDHEFDGLACYETEDSLFTELFLHDNPGAGISTDLQFNGNVIANAMLLRNGTHGIFMRDSNRNLMQAVYIRDSGRQGIFIDQVDKKIETGACGNSFTGLTIERSQGAAVRINAPSCKDTLFTGAQFFDNKEGISEAEPGLAEARAE